MPLVTLSLAAVLALAVRPECGRGIEPARLAAVAKVESAFDPLLIHVNGNESTVLHPATAKEASQLARLLIAQHRSIDLGLMQINSGPAARAVGRRRVQPLLQYGCGIDPPA